MFIQDGKSGTGKCNVYVCMIEGMPGIGKCKFIIGGRGGGQHKCKSNKHLLLEIKC